jgi:putative glutamine amidotransferase
MEETGAHVVLEPYISAIRDAAQALPLLVPALDPPLSCGDVLAAVDGLLFPGSESNVAPDLYGGHTARDPSLLDVRRDRLVQPLARAAAVLAVPILAICRGTQELNVALGGTLHQHIHEIEGRLDHRERKGVPEDEAWGAAHVVTVAADGVLAGIVPSGTFEVNSLHSQGIDRLAPTLRAEAFAPDGQIEAVSGAAGFLLGLQWHPEWRWENDEVSRSIFGAFAEALRRA